MFSPTHILEGQSTDTAPLPLVRDTNTTEIGILASPRLHRHSDAECYSALWLPYDAVTNTRLSRGQQILCGHRSHARRTTRPFHTDNNLDPGGTQSRVTFETAPSGGPRAVINAKASRLSGSPNAPPLSLAQHSREPCLWIKLGEKGC